MGSPTGAAADAVYRRLDAEVEIRLAHLDAAEPMAGDQEDQLFHLIEREHPALPSSSDAPRRTAPGAAAVEETLDPDPALRFE